MKKMFCGAALGLMLAACGSRDYPGVSPGNPLPVAVFGSFDFSTD
jgi:hypothetical protein